MLQCHLLDNPGFVTGSLRDFGIIDASPLHMEYQISNGHNHKIDAVFEGFHYNGSRHLVIAEAKTMEGSNINNPKKFIVRYERSLEQLKTYYEELRRINDSLIDGFESVFGVIVIGYPKSRRSGLYLGPL